MYCILYYTILLYITVTCLLQNLFIVETLEIVKNAHVIGEVDVELAFSYGCFGYGYSSQVSLLLYFKCILFILYFINFAMSRHSI